jgi:hypothetical protein
VLIALLSFWKCFYLSIWKLFLAIHPPMAVHPLLGSGLPQYMPSFVFVFSLFSSIFVFLGSVMFPSGRHPPIFLLVFQLVLCYEISH